MQFELLKLCLNIQAAVAYELVIKILFRLRYYRYLSFWGKTMRIHAYRYRNWQCRSCKSYNEAYALTKLRFAK